jgi:hypothetical protein
MSDGVVRVGILILLTMKSIISLDVMPCNLVVHPLPSKILVNFCHTT